MASFTGRWLVSESIYQPDGSFAGIVRQQRHVEPTGESRIRVLQECTPAPELAGHAMDAFRGKWEFELLVQGQARQYLGPDVIGTGVAYGTKYLLGQGIWPRFGYNFTSFSVLLDDRTQITGGKFSRGHCLIANIVGLGTAETDESRDRWLSLNPLQPADFRQGAWDGQTSLYGAQGNLKLETAIHSERSDNRLIFSWDNAQLLEIAAQPDRQIVTGALTMPGGSGTQVVHGERHHAGCMAETILFTPTGIRIEIAEIAVSASSMILVQRWFQRHILHHVEFSLLIVR
jgi:hypothetical protein